MESPISSISDQVHDLRVRTNYYDRETYFWPKGCLDNVVTGENAATLKLICEELKSQPNDPLISFTVGRAKMILVIIINIDFPNARRAMELFKEKEISDKDLPLMEHHFDSLRTSEKLWNNARRDKFLEEQWKFLVPTFDFQHSVHNWSSSLILLPFISKEKISSGGYGKVFKCKIHPDHVIMNGSMSYCPEFVAVKLLQPDDKQRATIMRDWEKEADVLRKMNTLDNDDGHIVRFLTAFCTGSTQTNDKEYCLMFEWADGGNLKDLWDSYPRPQLREGLIRGVATQLHGLSHMLRRAHYPGGNGGKNYRHTDLKPANILWFKHDPKNGENAEEAGLGRLKIGDWGLAKDHGQTTDLRPDGTSNHAGTVRYEPPEESDRPDSLNVPGSSRRKRSRLYDIWAMGCVSLEFLIWLMYGIEALNDFNESFDGPFYEVRGGQARVHPQVQRWIEHMKKDPICQAGTTALGDLLKVVEVNLLVVDLPPGGAEGTLRLPTRVDSGSANEPEILPESERTDGPPTIEIVDAPADVAQPALTEGKLRSNAKLFKTRMDEIVGKISTDEANDKYWFKGEPVNKPPTSEADNTDSNTTIRHQDSHGQLAVRSTGVAAASSRRVRS